MLSPEEKDRANMMADMIIILGEILRREGSMPASEFYGLTRGRIPPETFEYMVQILKNAGVVLEAAGELIWIGGD
jgi:hypothetical protein